MSGVWPLARSASPVCAVSWPAGDVTATAAASGAGGTRVETLCAEEGGSVTRMNVKPARTNKYEAFMRALCHDQKLPTPVAEYVFAPPRRWRFDLAWPDQRVAIEVQGGLFTRGRHTRGAALLKEHAKLNAAASGGWRVLYCTPKDVLLIIPALAEALKRTA